MKLITLLPSLMAESCPPMELTVGNVIGKTVDVPYIGQFCQYVAIPYAEPPERWRPSVKKHSSVTQVGEINFLEKRPLCPDIGRETVPEVCIKYFFSSFIISNRTDVNFSLLWISSLLVHANLVS